MSKGPTPKGSPSKTPPPKGPAPKAATPAAAPAKGYVCPEFKASENKCGVDGFKFYEGMNKPCNSPGITKAKCPRFAMK